MPTQTAIDLANKFRARLIAQEADSAARMGRIYSRIYARLLGDIDALADDIFAMGDKIDRREIIKLGRMQRLLSQVEVEAAQFGTIVTGEVENARLLAIQQGVDDALDLIDASLPPLPNAVRREIAASLTRLPADAIEAAAGILGPDSPLVDKLGAEYGKAVSEQVANSIVDGLAVGQNPRTIARALQRNLQNGLGTGLNWIMTTVRTAQIKSYQTANHATYLANSKIVPEWVWVSSLDERTCMSCLAKHGSVHPVTEPMNDHHNGRCAPLPKTISYKALGINAPDPVEEIPSGEQWFEQQPASLQKKMMGAGKYEAWQDGKFNFADLSTPYQDDVYGELLRETTLTALLK